jgi:signal transduction histidine kinase
MLNDFQKLLFGCSTVDEVYPVAGLELIDMYGFQAGAIYLHAKSGELARVALFGRDAEGYALTTERLPPESYRLAEGIPGRVVLPGVSDGHGTAAWLPSVTRAQFGREFGTFCKLLGQCRNVLALPLYGHRQSFGAILLFNKLSLAGGVDLSPEMPGEERASAQTAAGILASSIKLARAGTYRSMASRIVERVTLDREPAATDETDGVIREALRLIVSAPTDFCAVVLRLETEPGVLTVAAKEGSPEIIWDYWEDARVDAQSACMAARVYASGKPILIYDVAHCLADPGLFRNAAWVLKNGIRSAASFPLISMGRVIGTMTVYAQFVHSFPGRTREWVTMVAQPIAARFELNRSARKAAAVFDDFSRTTKRLDTEVATNDRMSGALHNLTNDIHRLSKGVLGILQSAEEEHLVDEKLKAIQIFIDEMSDDIAQAVRREGAETTVDIERFVGSILEHHRLGAFGLDIVWSTQCDRPRRLFMDEVRLRTILHNLIDNGVHAIEASMEEGSLSVGLIKVGVTKIETGGESYLAISVEDNAGASREQLARMNESGYSSRGDGHGTGLARVRRAAQYYSGWIEITSSGYLTRATAYLNLAYIPEKNAQGGSDESNET